MKVLESEGTLQAGQGSPRTPPETPRETPARMIEGHAAVTQSIDVHVPKFPAWQTGRTELEPDQISLLLLAANSECSTQASWQLFKLADPTDCAMHCSTRNSKASQES